MSLEKIILITIFFELIEIYFQYGSSFKKSILKLYYYYQKSPILFFLIHPSYIWMLFLSLIYSNLTIPMVIAIALKIFDIITKLDLIKEINEDEIEEGKVAILNIKIPIWVYFISLFTYPYLIYLAFSS